MFGQIRCLVLTTANTRTHTDTHEDQCVRTANNEIFRNSKDEDDEGLVVNNKMLDIGQTNFLLIAYRCLFVIPWYHL